MKVVLLAAGRSFRMKPIEDKIFVTFLGKPLIAHQLEALKKAGFRDIVIVVGRHNLKRIKALAWRAQIVEQRNLDEGMAGAVLAAEKHIKDEPFLVVSANDVVDESAFEFVRTNLSKKKNLLVAKKVSSYFPGGYLKLGVGSRVQKIVEKPKPGNEPSDLVNLVIHYHHNAREFFSVLKKVHCEKDDRYECALQTLIDSGIDYYALRYTGFWQPIKYPWHILVLMEHYMSRMLGDGEMKKGKNVSVAPSAVIKGGVYLDDGVQVMENAVIQGPAYVGKNSLIATNALVRQSHIGSHCVIGFGSEIARSYLGDGVWTHANYLGDSVIGNNVSFGAGTVAGNLRLDGKNIFVTIKDEKIDSGLTKLGLVAGDNIRTGINASFMPGVKIGSNSCIGAGIVVAQDVPENTYVAGEWKLKVKPNRVTISPRGRL